MSEFETLFANLSNKYPIVPHPLHVQQLRVVTHNPRQPERVDPRKMPAKVSCSRTIISGCSFGGQPAKTSEVNRTDLQNEGARSSNTENHLERLLDNSR